MSKQGVVNELHRPARKNFPRRHVIIKGLDDLWQSDLAEFGSYARYNKGYRYILVVIDCFSKYLWTRPLKTKAAGDVRDAMREILSEGRVPSNLQTDAGREYYNKMFENLMAKHGINHYSTYSTKKASIAERVIRTLKGKLYKEFSLRGEYKWIDKLPEITASYNKTKHGTTGMRPQDIRTKKTEKLLLSTVYNNLGIAGKPRFKVGDVVRISKYKSVFDKSYLPNWTTELFRITKVKISNPPTYLLEDMNGRPILGSFYGPEMQKTLYKDVYLIEKVLRRKGSKVYVKWLGLDSSHNSWIDKKDLL